jgi:hypothetical protein
MIVHAETFTSLRGHLSKTARTEIITQNLKLEFNHGYKISLEYKIKKRILCLQAGLCVHKHKHT